MLESELKSLLKLSIQRLLLGEVYPSIRAVSFDNQGSEKLRLVYYLDREPTDIDHQSLSNVSAEVLADIDFEEVEEVCEYTKMPFSDLRINNLVYLRKE